MAKSIFKCKICNEKYTSLEGLYSHIEEEHSALIPPDMSVEQYYYYLKTGREHGSCVVCKGKTPWNPKTKKYHRFCGDPDCKAKYKETVDQRMIGKYGKVNLLNDPDHQRKMLMNRSISGHYDFDGVSKPYVGSYELDFLKTMDLFLNWDPKDIEMPSPHTYYYEYNGEKHFYIPDAFIYSLGLEIEIKDGGNNPNMHHKIQDVDKEKERLKDEVMHNQKLHHYIKLTNKNYWNLFEFFRISKEHVEKYGDYEKIPKIILDEDIGAKKISSNSRNLMKEKASEALVENSNTVSEGFEPDKALVWFDKPIDKIMNKTIKIYHGSSVLINGKVIDPISPNVGATKISKPRWSTYFWDNREDAMIWAVTDIVFDHYGKIAYNGHNDRTYVGKPKNIDNREFTDYLINLLKEFEFYIYECEVNIHDLEIGSAPSIREYTVSKPVKILKRYNYHLNRDIVKRCLKIMNEDELNNFKKNNPGVKHYSSHRGPILNNILDPDRDINRALIKTEVRQGNVKAGVDDISDFQYSINRHHKLGTYYLKENYDHIITIGLNKNMKRGLYGFADNNSYILFDEKVQLKRVNNIMQPLTENFDISNDIDIIKFGINKDIDINLEGMNKGAYLRWNRNDELETLLEQISNEWFDSKLNVEDFIRIEDDE